MTRMLALSDTTPRDPRRSEDNTMLIGDLRRLGMVHDTIAVPRPGKMDTRPGTPRRPSQRGVPERPRWVLPEATATLSAPVARLCVASAGMTLASGALMTAWRETSLVSLASARGRAT